MHDVLDKGYFTENIRKGTKVKYNENESNKTNVRKMAAIDNNQRANDNYIEPVKIVR